MGASRPNHAGAAGRDNLPAGKRKRYARGWRQARKSVDRGGTAARRHAAHHRRTRVN